MYKKQIEEIEKFFMWEFIMMNLADKDLIKMIELRQLSLADVLDYLVIRKQQNRVDELRDSKNILPI